MDVFLGKITQHAMNYAIRAGIGITASYTLRQTSRLLKTVDNNNTDYQELQALQERLNSKIKIISPAIDLIELISARGNTTLESAVTLTKSLRWDIQALGLRLAKAATAEESSRRKKTNTKVAHEAEIHLIVKDIKNLLVRIEDAVPLINLAITTSGASLSTSLPASVSPSRLLQASTFLTAGDAQYSINSDGPSQVGPAFMLSLYMLFAGHSYRVSDPDSMRDTTWKEAIHKARVRLMRIPIQHIPGRNFPILESIENDGKENPILTGENRQNEYAYHIEMIEDLEDDRVHTFDENEAQPGPYEGVSLAGIRDVLPIYQISKIFYADTGKILNIGSQGETNNPVLLLKRDINALPPRRMMEEGERSSEWYDEEPETLDEAVSETSVTEEGDSQDDIDQQLRRESSMPKILEITHEQKNLEDRTWRLPADLDPEWMALEVYTETDDSSSDDGLDVNDDSAYVSHRPSSSGEQKEDESLAEGLAYLNLDPGSSPSASPAQQVAKSTSLPSFSTPKTSPFGPIRSSLSLLEMLIRLTALQQFQQASHLSIPDELLTFFLVESSTTGAGGDGEERRRTRREARQKVGFDPYDESPVKQRGEDYQYQHQSPGQDRYVYSRGGTPYQDHNQNDGYPPGSPRWTREQSQSMPPQGTPEPWLLRSREETDSQRGSPDVRPSTPVSPYRPHRKTTRPLDRVQAERSTGKGSPLGRGVSVGTDSTLGTSPGSPKFVDRDAKT
ncbi:related to YRB30 Inhibitor of RanGAP1(Rna1p)-mediated GTP hydrolysis [Rhynchosporium secalis]|uniref:Related to YRB30 Inhibitor of RanGAP1(Rna1p)-mediated GTP hydrolysis n=1 Tax=Rhynchosporium secalis TaxID=38038 RepID=A0A1E1MQB0_RHYSE|nr:related to YRB30 Inhibitor of RanGAP1(Rna1p)-mediated GTP hydrolysis [Rhynchosporium secalis]